MSDALYHEAIVGAAREAVGAGSLAEADGRAFVDNPLCGDRVRMEVAVRDGRLHRLAHEVRGCVLCEAAAAVIGRVAPGLPLARVRAGEAAARALLGHAQEPEGEWRPLAMFAPVAGHPSRHDCVLLPFEALREALDACRGSDGRCG